MAKITVCSKLPHGFVMEVKGDPQKVTLPGNRAPLDENGMPINPRDVTGGYTMTQVDEAFYKQWEQEMGKEFAPIASGAIFASGSKATATAEAMGAESVVTGLEPKDPKKPGGKVSAFNPDKPDE